MVSIYLIEDINDLKYIGSTTQKLNQRLTEHKHDKKRGNYCSSCELNLYNCIIIELEQCDLEHRKERERYYINEIDCVNQIKLNFDKDKKKEYREKNKETIKEYMREYREKNKDKINQRQKEYNEKNKGKNKEYLKEYYQKNKEKILEQQKEYQKKKAELIDH